VADEIWRNAAQKYSPSGCDDGAENALAPHCHCPYWRNGMRRIAPRFGWIDQMSGERNLGVSRRCATTNGRHYVVARKPHGGPPNGKTKIAIPCRFVVNRLY
jgi:hypothetical protein